MIAEPKSEKTLARIAAALETSFVFKGIEQSVLQQVCPHVPGLVCMGTSLGKRQGSRHGCSTPAAILRAVLVRQGSLRRHSSSLDHMHCMHIRLYAQDFIVSMYPHASCNMLSSLHA